jgi:SAM-dependent methyltransferase
VAALELQPALHTIAVDLTQRSGLDERVTHICADALTYAFPDAAFDAVVSWLAFLHIPDRPRLCTRLARTLRAGGGCYVEDLCIRAPFSAADLRVVRDVVFGVSMTSIEDYANDLRSAGFVNVETTDLTGDWSPYATRGVFHPPPRPRERGGFAERHPTAAGRAARLPPRSNDDPMAPPSRGWAMGGWKAAPRSITHFTGNEWVS